MVAAAAHGPVLRHSIRRVRYQVRNGDSYPVGQRGGRLKKDSLRFIVPYPYPSSKNPFKAIDPRTFLGKEKPRRGGSAGAKCLHGVISIFSCGAEPWSASPPKPFVAAHFFSMAPMASFMCIEQPLISLLVMLSLAIFI